MRARAFTLFSKRAKSAVSAISITKDKVDNTG